ncbi:mannan endo-1,4-beta-mannosidase 2 [Gossypium hirsutum]|uniref:mannan endo-1,4-beta-mannosidase n=1 Tax=Gossypium hirsutum TaxID=3635 RepID=A0A1U8KLH0_GOSHI|nr:mannan endo-1,4-beta-mannosidase 2-like [Gossypium hirsutum]
MKSDLHSHLILRLLTLYRKPMGGNGVLYPILGFASCVAFIYMSFGDLKLSSLPKGLSLSFVERNGSHFILDGKPLYVNGWNSYWLMAHSMDENSRGRVSVMLQAGAKMGLTVCRTWAFNDGGYEALQISPGQFDERVFQALDYVIAEASRHGIRLLLSLVNNLQAYGGKTQYVKWAWQEGIGLSSSNDSFFFDPSIRKYFKNYVLDVLTRKNTITGIEYRNDPTIFAWELINEPRCMSDPSGDTLQEWIEEMTGFIKSIDKNHLLTIGLEGLYGPKSPKSAVNPGEWASTLGSDFVCNSNITNVDFTSVHIYPDHWFHDLGFEEKQRYVSKWVRSHIEDCDEELKKPVMFTEYGLSNQNKDFQASQREQFYRTILDIIYKSAKKKGSGVGALVWQFLVEGIEEYNDDFGLVPWETPSIHKLTIQQSCRLARIQGLNQQTGNLKQLCS